jgi:hypothetical protein
MRGARHLVFASRTSAFEIARSSIEQGGGPALRCCRALTAQGAWRQSATGRSKAAGCERGGNPQRATDHWATTY